jgi:sugar phosphate isomerase/epimerase
MALGVYTACMQERSLADVAGWAAVHGFTSLDVAVGPGSHLDAAVFDERAAAGVRQLLERHGLGISSLTYLANNLHPHHETREGINAYVLATVRAADLLGCPTVTTLVGRDFGRSIVENIDEAERVFLPVAEAAGEVGIRVAIENAVMEHWHPDGYPGNLAYSPELWEWLASIDLFLTLDPAHLIALGIDPVRAIEGSVSRIVHVQANDVEIFSDRIDRYGWPGRAGYRVNPADSRWWAFRLPGLGGINWPAVMSALREGGFTGAVCVENADPQWSGAAGLVEAGLDAAHRTLSDLAA